ncbi:MAG: hypothetical protein IH877_07350 [Gemmatimonadetes bacterium]|nr:hypothetical protein [Gemmatimonadota bacterium]
MDARHSSVAVIFSDDGEPLTLASLGDIPSSRVLRAQFARGEMTSCVAATVEHECGPAELAAELRAWAGRKGWSVTVAPLRSSR